MSEDNVVDLFPEKNRSTRTLGQIFDQAGSKIDLALALLVGRSGGKKVVIFEPENGDGFGVQVVREFVDEAQPLIRDGESLLTVLLKRVRYKDLEQIADQVKVLD